VLRSLVFQRALQLGWLAWHFAELRSFAAKNSRTVEEGRERFRLRARVELFERQCRPTSRTALL
jgi:hypothetical protein